MTDNNSASFETYHFSDGLTSGGIRSKTLIRKDAEAREAVAELKFLSPKSNALETKKQDVFITYLLDHINSQVIEQVMSLPGMIIKPGPEFMGAAAAAKRPVAKSIQPKTGPFTVQPEFSSDGTLTYEIAETHKSGVPNKFCEFKCLDRKLRAIFEKAVYGATLDLDYTLPALIKAQASPPRSGPSLR